MTLIERVCSGADIRPEDVPGQPYSVIMTLEAGCNLRCLHCCWRHELPAGWRNWDSYINQIASWPECSITYAGRMLTPRATQVLRDLAQRCGKRLDVVDHGYTITRYPELFPLYGTISISIDGCDEDHDRQRDKSGAATVAWNAVQQLRDARLDPVVACCVSPLNIARWGEFEDWLCQREIGLSCTPVYRFSSPVNRGMSFFSDASLCAAMQTLLNGIPKHINLYDERDVQALLPLLQQGTWRPSKNGLLLEGQFPGDITVFYSPLCLSRVSNRELRFDGKWTIPAERVIGEDPGRWPVEVAAAANEALKTERLLITQLLERR